MNSFPSESRWSTVLAIVWLGAVMVLTLSPVRTPPTSVAHVSHICLICGTRGTADAVLNVLLFVPLGAVLARRGLKVRSAALVGALVSSLVEIAQLFIPGRYATLGDIAWNTTGAGVGAAFLVALPRLLGEDDRPVHGPITLLAALPALLFPVGGWLLSPHGSDRPYWGQWTADLGYMPHYEGQLLDARLDGTAVPRARFSDDASTQRAFLTDWTLSAILVKGPPPNGVAPVVSIYDSDQREIVVLGVDGEDLVWRERTWANALRLDQPDIRLVATLDRIRVGDTVTVAARRRGHDRCLSVNDFESCGLGFTPGRTWALLMYVEELPDGVRRLLDSVWMALLFVPIGLLARGTRGLVAATAASATLLTIAILGTRLILGPWTELLGIAAGGGVGRALRSLALRHGRRT